ncbi:MAG TPA: nucleotide pyrophosphatase/phosphodiesterase family protein [Pirellulales bacterium]|nr:nucleotide pyrophosphatase/phosphodiesterase family protein [Pirellulales bacterium]
MTERVVLLSIPGLRAQDLVAMPNLRRLAEAGETATLVPSFPCVTCPVQANMTTGVMPREHGVVANGFYWREKHEVEMWTAWNDCIERPQIWDRLHEHDASIRSAVWFPLHSKGAGADYICTPAPIHNPDGSESLWCYTKPTEMYGTLRDALGHFPLMNFWGPMAGIKSTAWIVDSAVYAAREYRPDFFYIYLPHLDYAAQRTGPDSEPARRALGELDETIGRLVTEFHKAYGEPQPLWLVASEYTITPVDHVTYPNRTLREAGLLAVTTKEDGEHLDFAGSEAWALVDHQFAHVFVSNPAKIGRVVDLFRGKQGIGEVLAGDERARYELDHERAGEVVLVSTPNSWQAYYWWLDDARAPKFARTVDIHRKPGYDPVELHFDPATKSIPLDASRVRGSHGAPARSAAQRGVILASQKGVLVGGNVADTDVFGLVTRQWGI